MTPERLQHRTGQSHSQTMDNKIKSSSKATDASQIRCHQRFVDSDSSEDDIKKTKNPKNLNLIPASSPSLTTTNTLSSKIHANSRPLQQQSPVNASGRTKSSCNSDIEPGQREKFARTSSPSLSTSSRRPDRNTPIQKESPTCQDQSFKKVLPSEQKTPKKQHVPLGSPIKSPQSLRHIKGAIIEQPSITSSPSPPSSPLFDPLSQRSTFESPILTKPNPSSPFVDTSSISRPKKHRSKLQIEPIATLPNTPSTLEDYDALNHKQRMRLGGSTVVRRMIKEKQYVSDICIDPISTETEKRTPIYQAKHTKLQGDLSNPESDSDLEDADPFAAQPLGISSPTSSSESSSLIPSTLITTRLNSPSFSLSSPIKGPKINDIRAKSVSHKGNEISLKGSIEKEVSGTFNFNSDSGDKGSESDDFQQQRPNSVGFSKVKRAGVEVKKPQSLIKIRTAITPVPSINTGKLLEPYKDIFGPEKLEQIFKSKEAMERLTQLTMKHGASLKPESVSLTRDRGGRREKLTLGGGEKPKIALTTSNWMRNTNLNSELPVENSQAPTRAISMRGRSRASDSTRMVTEKKESGKITSRELDSVISPERACTPLRNIGMSRSPSPIIGTPQKRSTSRKEIDDEAVNLSPSPSGIFSSSEFQLPSPRRKRQRACALDEYYFLPDDDLPVSYTKKSSDDEIICPYCGDELPKNMSTRLSNAWTKVLAQQQRIEQLEQERQERIKQKQAKRERVIDADLNPSVEFSSFPERSYKFLDESKAGASRTKRNSQPRPRRLERLKNKIQDFGADSNNSNSNTRPAEDSVIKIESDDNGSDNSVDDEDEGLSLLRRPGNQMSLLDKFEFCRVHVAEARIVPLGIQNNYPFYIKFHELSKRVSKIESQLRCIIEGTVSSTFLDMALNQYKQLGTQGARNPHVIMANVERTMPGYYGSKGSAELSKILARMFLETNILTHERARPQTPIEYIQHVLVPEAGLRLIAEDQAKIMRGSSDLKEGKDHSVITLEEARLIMQESVEFGNYMHDVELH